MTRGGVRTYRALLRVLPASFRSHAERELVEVFLEGRARARARGVGALARFWSRALLDLAVTASAEHAAARRRFTPLHSAVRTGSPMTHTIAALVADLRLAGRLLARTPGWATVAASTLALGVGALVVAGVLARDVLLRPLPVPESDRLVRIIEISDDGRGWWPSYPNARDWREHARMFDIVGIIGTSQTTPVILETEAVRANVGRAGADVFRMLGAASIAGRVFLDVEHRADGAPVAVIGETFWRGALGGRDLRDLVLTLGERRYDVVGVLPATFKSLNEVGRWETAPDVWLPLEQQQVFGNRSSHGSYHVVARLAPGVTLDAARVEMDELAATLKTSHGEFTQADRVRLTPLHEIVVRGAREPLQLLWYAGLGVLFIAGLNLSAALLAQGLSRTRELAIRGALGATRLRITMHLLAGAAVLAVPATVAGIGLGALGLRVVKAYAAGTWPRLDEAVLDWQAAAAALAVAAITAVVAGLLPAFLLSRAGRGQLRARGATNSARDSRLWTSFVVGQIALTVLLLVGSGLLTRSLWRAATVDLGFDPEHVVVVDVTLPIPAYADAARREAFYRSALERLREVPGVSAAGLTSVLPDAPSAYTASTGIEGNEYGALMAGYRVVDAGYFAAMRIPSRVGDVHALETGLALVDQRLTDQLWDGASPVGAHVRNSFHDGPLEVAGVVGTVREWNDGSDTTGAIYIHYTRRPLSTMTLVLRHESGLAASVAGDARRVLRQIDPLVPVRVEPFAPRVKKALDDQRLLVALAGGFGVTALLLAGAGVYAMIAFAVARRAREAAIRLALGARPQSLIARVLFQALRPAAAGAVAGLLLTIPLAGTLRARLFQVAVSDPLVLVAASLSIAVAAAVASIVPARRFARIDPVLSLRNDT